MALVDIEVLANNATFLARVKGAMVGAAVAVQAEAPETPNHENRARYAQSVLHQLDALGAQMAWGVAANPTILAQGEAGSSDGDIQFTVESLWDAYAGVV